MNLYFVSFMHWRKDKHGVGCEQLSLEKPVTGWEDIQAMASEIRRLDPTYTEVTILNWRRFEDHE
jgi:hypothetical protein